MSDADRDRELEAAVAAYRADLTASAALAEGEVAELEDHLRELIDELRGAGTTSAAAIAEARRRLGEPAQVAAECARVRTAFGLRLAPVRAWSAGVILLGLALWTAWSWLSQPGVSTWVGIDVALGLILVAGLAARRTWPRAILLGHAAMSTVALAAFNARYPHIPALQVTLAAHAAATALLVPWGRRELTGAGWALAAWSTAYVGASFAQGHGAILPTLALAGVMVAALGTVLRARWGIVVGLATAGLHVLLAIALVVLRASGRPSGLAEPDLQITLALVGAAAAVVAPLLAWRSTRPGAGDLRALVLG